MLVLAFCVAGGCEMARGWLEFIHGRLWKYDELARTTRQLAACLPRPVAAAFLLDCLTLLFCSACLAQLPDFAVPASGQATGTAAQSPAQGQGSISGRIVDPNGSPVVGANVQLLRDTQPTQQAQTDQDGRFAFTHISAGPYQLTISEQGFAPQTISRTLRAGEASVIPQVTLALATQVTKVVVSPPTEDVAQAQLKEQVSQRIFGFIPNFYVTYLGANTVPLSSGQKFHLALKASTDPVVFLGVGLVAGMNQAGDRYSDYGQGVEGYAKRFGASYATFNSGLWIGGAILPSILKQDPRYFYRGTGTRRSRICSRTIPRFLATLPQGGCRICMFRRRTAAPESCLRTPVSALAPRQESTCSRNFSCGK
jgi:Carboxypeptidase regulatory-like domain